ncbi:hypothetical protein GCM10018781_78160 [Kitasatospora indigofera]|uniref:Uncharacterized protein n=1 Tax=Kitasatospora indigofera TaxID=67307 RepID=A0A918YVJ0_9ACTN|nr:hypothetical protein [Kitasatospora indigofera]GHE26108.1 hypothetical protein GCM10018781_78160 [Kitasatospora indigofera]
MQELPESVDRHILDHRIVPALKAVMDASGCTLHQAIDIFGVRYEELRRDRPDDFRVSPEEYGRNVYT